MVWRFNTSLSSEVDASPPSVNASTLVPTNDAVVNLDSSVSVEFTEGMLRGTVEGSFLLQSNDGNNPDSRDHRNGRFTWIGKKVVYVPNEPLGMNDDQYRVSLNNNG